MSDIKKQPQPRTSLKNVINDIFNSKIIMESIRKVQNSNSNISDKINKEERITNIKLKILRICQTI